MGGFDFIKGVEGIGKSIGQELGSGVGRAFGGKKGEAAGRNIGGALGSVAAPAAGIALGAFKTGGRVPGKRGRPLKAIVHGGEFVLPVGVAPTAAQKKAVAKRKADAKKKK